MTDKYKWLDKFYKDMQNNTIHYSKQLPDVCMVADVPISNVENDMISKSIIDRNDRVADDTYVTDIATHSNYYEVSKGKKYTKYKNNIDAFFFRFIAEHQLYNLIIDNKFLRKHNENTYRAVVLNAVDDYVDNQFPDALMNEEIDVLTVPGIAYAANSCVLFLDESGSCFYMVPLCGFNWNDYKYPVETINDQVHIQSDHELPIIDVTVKYLHQFLNKKNIPLTVTHFSKYKVKHPYYVEYKYIGKVDTWATSNCKDHDYCSQIDDIYILGYQDEINHYHNDYGDSQEIANCKMYKRALYNDYEPKINEQGEVFYQISNHGKLVHDSYQHISTQNLSDKVFDDVKPNLDLVSQDMPDLAKNMDVETIDIPSNPKKQIEPIVQANGLNGIFKLTKSRTDHHYYSYDKYLMQVNYDQEEKEMYMRMVEVQ